MSFAIHLFVEDKFSEVLYKEYLGKAQNLFGTWQLEEEVPFNKDTQHLTIHCCWVYLNDPASRQLTRVNIEAVRHVKEIPVWPFDYEWHLRLETSVGRVPMTLAVQLGAWLLAMRRFRYSLAFDHDTDLKDEPTEFRSIESAAEHAKRVLREDFKCSAELVKGGFLNENGYLQLPSDTLKTA